MRLWDDADHDHDNEGNDDNCEDEKLIEGKNIESLFKLSLDELRSQAVL